MKELFAKLRRFMGVVPPPIKHGPEKEMAHMILMDCKALQSALPKPLNSSGLLLYRSYHRASVRSIVADITFAIHQIEDIGYITRVTAKSMKSVQVEDGLSLYEFAPAGPAHVAEYVTALARLTQMYQNMLDADTTEANHTVVLLTDYLSVHQKALANYVRCI